jgi:hypothetical protein
LALELDGATVFGPDTLQLKPYTTYYVYAVGDFFTGSFQYLVFAEDGSKTGRPQEARERRAVSTRWAR